MEDSVQEKKAKPDPVISLFALGTLCRYKQTSLIIFQDYCSNGRLYKKILLNLQYKQQLWLSENHNDNRGGTIGSHMMN